MRLAAFGAVGRRRRRPKPMRAVPSATMPSATCRAIGVLLHQMLCGTGADEADVSLVIARMPPHGRDLVRLPWTTPQPVSEGLRAIANRCTASQERQRYLNASHAAARAGRLARGRAARAGRPDRAADRPAAQRRPSAGAAGHPRRLAKLSFTDTQRTDEMAELLLLQDIALSFELLRTVNSAQVRGTQVAGNGPVLTLRRAIALLGVDGVRNTANACASGRGRWTKRPRRRWRA